MYLLVIQPIIHTLLYCFWFQLGHAIIYLGKGISYHICFPFILKIWGMLTRIIFNTIWP